MSRLKPLFLIAGGSSRDPKRTVSMMTRVLHECDRKKSRVAYLGMANGDSAPFFLSMRALLQSAGAGEVSMVRLANAEADVAAAKRVIEAADVVYLSGGEVEDGMRWLRQHGLVPFLGEMRSQGKMFVGMSAGSIMMGTHWVSWENEDDDSTARLFDCLGFAPTTFDTHGEHEDWKELKMALLLQGIGARGYGIPSGGLVSVDDQENIVALERDLLLFENVEGKVLSLAQ